LVEARANQASRALQLPLPRSIPGRDVQRVLLKRDYGRTGNRWPDRSPPREGDLFIRQWCLSDDRSERGGQDRLNWNHGRGS
jgi:hypothetical protein